MVRNSRREGNNYGSDAVRIISLAANDHSTRRAGMGEFEELRDKDVAK